MPNTRTSSDRAPRDASQKRNGFKAAFHGVRYQVADVARSVDFYTTHLGFTLEHEQLPAFGSFHVKTLRSRSSALLVRVTRADHRLPERLRREVDAGMGSPLTEK